MPTAWADIAKSALRTRPDYSICITHRTKKNGEMTAFDVLKKIITERKIISSTTKSGFIKGNKRATCFTETPVSAISRAFLIDGHINNEAQKYIKWEPYGLSFLKPVIYVDYGGRPVLYLSNDECNVLCPPGSDQANHSLWRVVRLDQTSYNETIDFSHEREWRVPSDVDFSKLKSDLSPLAIVHSTDQAEELIGLYPPAEASPIRGVVSLYDLRLLG